MKIYEGRRTIDGLVVTVDGAPLSEHGEVKQFTRYGFEWTLAKRSHAERKRCEALFDDGHVRGSNLVLACRKRVNFDRFRMAASCRILPQ
jgi:hypothetical protein